MADYNIVVKESPLSKLMAELPQLLLNFQLRQQEMEIEADREARRYTFEREQADAQRTHESTLLDTRLNAQKEELDKKLTSQEDLLDKRLTADATNLETRLDAESTNLQTQIDSRFDLLDKELDAKEAIAREERELAAEIDHYKDAKMLHKQTNLLLKEAEGKWLQTGLQLDNLYDTDITEEALNLLDTFSTYEANQYQEKGDMYWQMAENAEEKINIINSALAGVVRKGSLFAQAGGDQGMGLGDPTKWDTADLDYNAFILQNPDLNDREKEIAKEWFDANAPVVQASLRDLRQDRINLEQIESKNKYYQQETEESQIKKLKAGSVTFFNRRLTKIDGAVNLSGLKTAELILRDPSGQAGIDTSTEEGLKQYNEIKIKVDDAKATIAVEFGELIGEKDLALQKPEEYLAKFDMMIKTARGEYLSATKQFSTGDYSDFVFYVDKAWENYAAMESGSDMSKFERLARKYFGFPEDLSFKEFVIGVKQYYNHSILGDLDSLDLIQDISGDVQLDDPFNPEQADVDKVESLIKNEKLLNELESIINEKEAQ
tara:strand:+ start:2016 stop:3659 length:1644 start_codon:yes stop_codon:yes gene_type:complete